MLINEILRDAGGAFAAFREDHFGNGLGESVDQVHPMVRIMLGGDTIAGHGRSVGEAARVVLQGRLRDGRHMLAAIIGGAPIAILEGRVPL